MSMCPVTGSSSGRPSSRSSEDVRYTGTSVATVAESLTRKNSSTLGWRSLAVRARVRARAAIREAVWSE